MAASVATAFIVCCCCVAAGPVRAGDDDGVAHAILFSGRDFWGNGAFLFGGMLWAPNGFERDGLVFKLMLSGGAYRYKAGDLGGERVIGAELVAQALPGFRVARNHFEAKVFFGPEYEYHRLWPDDPGNRLRGPAFGLRFAVELWDEPTPSTMIAADASLSTIDTNSSARLAFGWQVLDKQFYAGPETQVYGAQGYAQWRFGIHVTSFRTGDAEWSAAGGWAIDSDNRSSPYLRLGFMQRE
ncbi:MAG: cellulose biosynthesis protein BcsS [Pseudolabrys sp.]